MSKRLPGIFSGMTIVDIKSGCSVSNCIQRPRLVAAALFALLGLSLLASAERQPTRVYTTADGLPSTMVSCTVRDSHGFMWLCTREGLSRFDGYTFTNYGEEQGLPDRVVESFLETKQGEYWVGTGRGVALFNPKPSSPKMPMFTAFGTNDIGPVGALQQDANDIVWAASDRGLFQLVPTNGSWSLRRAAIQPGPDAKAEGFLADHAGYLWIVLYREHGQCELWRLHKNGQRDVFTDPFLADGNRINSLEEDREGRIWLGTYRGLALLVAQPQPGSRLIENTYPDHPDASTFLASDGRLWLGSKGTWEILTDPQGKVHFRLVDPTGHGFMGEDGQGNFWWANRKIERNGFIGYGTEDGLKTNDVRSIFQGEDGSLYFVTGLHNRYIHRFDGDHFTAVSPYMPGHDADWDWGGWGWGQTHLQDHRGEWWIATGHGVLRYPSVKRLEDLAHTSPIDFYADHNDIFRMYEDSRGDIWIAGWGGSMRWERSSESLVPLHLTGEPTAFREDRGSNLWIGYWGGGLSRENHGRNDRIIPQEGSSAGSVFSLFLDHAGRMWAGTTKAGLLRFDNPTADHPTFRIYSTKEGLSSNEVRAITEDHFGRIYFWTGRGVDRLNPETGAIRHYTEADGLMSAGADNNTAFCDRQGRLWFGFGAGGVSRLDPGPDRPALPPPIRVTAVRIRGVAYAVSELGETDLSGLVLQPNENQIQIEFASLNFGAGDVIKYQYKLEGAESDWSTPTELRVVNYPRLPSGRYRFLVRAINAEGMASPVPAAVGFRLLAPIWKRWWFLSVAGLIVLSLVYVAYRYRVRQLLELERVRTRIATDLHDDIGSSLTRIAIISEVARKRSLGDSAAAEPLSHIADLSRELVDSMSDIVWAINPRRDHLGDLTQRMRRLVSDVLEATDVEVKVHTPGDWGDTFLGADVRREVFLIFKEAVNNIVRHAQCTQVEISFAVRANQLIVEIQDDGRGFPAGQLDGSGHGLRNMQERARRLGGSLEWVSAPGQGTTLRLGVPLATRVRLFTSRHTPS